MVVALPCNSLFGGFHHNLIVSLYLRDYDVFCLGTLLR